jgi:hypothetical protein
MDVVKLQEELNRFSASPITKKSDRQLIANDAKSADYKQRFKDKAPDGILAYHKSGIKNSKLTQLQADEIRSKYLPNIYGKRRLAKEYNVSVALITKIIDRKIWND